MIKGYSLFVYINPLINLIIKNPLLYYQYYINSKF